MKVYVDESPAGSGKTYRSIERINRSKCKVLFFTERTNSFDELERDIRDAAQRLGTSPTIHQINGNIEGRSRNVVRQIEAVPVDYALNDHVIVIATHAAMLRSDFSAFAGWQIVVDEVPTFLDFEEKNTHLDVSFFSKYYHIQPLADGWSEITVTMEGEKISVADIKDDYSHSHLSQFHFRVLEASRPSAVRSVRCNLQSWSDMECRKVKWAWASVFSMRQLKAFDRVEMLGNQFRENIGCELVRLFDGDSVEWVPISHPAQARHFNHRDVVINYFSKERPISASFIKGNGGVEILYQIASVLRAQLPEEKSIWSANDKSDDGKKSIKKLLALPENDYLRPKQAGTNDFSRFSHAAMIYSAKPSNNMLQFMKALGISSENWTRSVEQETILQFVTRTSVRDPANGNTVFLWVFDRWQAEYLKDYFDGLPHVTATMTQIPLDIAVPPKSKGGRPRIIRTPQEQEAHRAEKRVEDTAKKRVKRAAKKAAEMKAKETKE
ncbi:hypothetical protein [Aquisediminimonas sediminicola]|uniref:hypothetical protein n=1 Tax=Alteraquisediminimonas sediminicola TaxID=2676787 RepID=UPI001C8DD23B|nr:hypothetical protein [Aquisediminimonas sediminicola]